MQRLQGTRSGPMPNISAGTPQSVKRNWLRPTRASQRPCPAKPAAQGKGENANSQSRKATPDNL